MIPDKEIRDIQAYLNDTLPQSRRSAFELKLQKDPELRHRLEELRPIFEVFEEMRMEEKIETILKKSEILERPEEVEVTPRPIKKLQPRFGNIVKYGIAAALLIFLGITWHDLTLYPRIYQDFYTPESRSSRGNESDSCPDKTTLDLYYQKNYQSFLQTLEKQTDSPCNNYYKGMAFLGLENPQKAIENLSLSALSDEISIKQKSEWYWVLAYLKNKESGKAKTVLQKIINTPEHQYENLAKDLMNQLDNKPIIFK